MGLERYLRGKQAHPLAQPKPVEAVKKLSEILPLKARAENELGYYGVQNPWSVINGRDVKIHEMVLFLVTYYCVKGCVIFDPTCGKENYQFREILDVIEYLGYRYISADIEPYGDIVHDVLGGLPLREGSIDLILYDPPYLPYARLDDRGSDYAVDVERSVLDVKKFYGMGVFKEFHRVLRDGGVLIVKGADFYDPVCSDNLYLFLTDIVDVQEVKRYFKPTALYIYRYFHRINALYRFRLKNRRRPVLTHTYFLVLKKQ